MLSAQSRQLIKTAVDLYGSSSQRVVWYQWANANRQVSTHADRLSAPKVPHAVLAAIMPALEQAWRAMLDRRETPGLSEDDISDLDNDLSHIRSVARHLGMVHP